MADKSYLFNFVVKGIDGLISGIGKATDKTKEAAKQIKRLREGFAKLYDTHRKEGGSVFSSLGRATKETVTQAGGLLKALTLISRVSAGGILLFLGSKAFQNNMGGIATAFARISAAFGQFWGKFNIVMNQLMREIGPYLAPFIKGVTDILVGLIKALSWLLDTFMKLPKALRLVIFALAGLAAVFWALSNNPFFIVLAAAVTLIYALYKGIKYIVDLFKSNSKLSMDANINYNGKQYQALGKSGISSTSDNSINNTTNNIYLQGSGGGVNDARLVANELSTLRSVNRTM